MNNIVIDETAERFNKYPSDSMARKIESLTGLDIDFTVSDQIWDEIKHTSYPESVTNNNEPY